jgi:hypothetical protein
LWNRLSNLPCWSLFSLHFVKGRGRGGRCGLCAEWGGCFCEGGGEGGYCLSGGERNGRGGRRLRRVRNKKDCFESTDLLSQLPNYFYFVIPKWTSFFNYRCELVIREFFFCELL